MAREIPAGAGGPTARVPAPGEDEAQVMSRVALPAEVPVGEIAAAIARQDEKFLRSLPGIGPQKAKNIVAQLQAKVAKFALARDGEPTAPLAARGAPGPEGDALREMVWDVLVKQLGHRPGEASQLIADAYTRRPSIGSAEELFDEIYRGAGAKA